MVAMVQYKRCSDVHKSRFMRPALLKPSSTKALFFLLFLQVMAPGVAVFVVVLALGGNDFKDKLTVVVLCGTCIQLKAQSTEDLFFLLLLQIMAPGVDIIGLNLGGTYFKATGTSFAAAHVAGAAALILQK